MNITEDWLKEKDACQPGIDWWKECGKPTVSETFSVIHSEPDYGRWLIEYTLDP